MTIDAVLTLFEYDAWATRQLLEGVCRLTPQQFTQEFNGATTSVRQQFVHLISVQDRYRARLMNEEPSDVQSENFATPADVAAYAEAVHKRMSAFLSQLAETNLTRVTTQATRRGIFRATVGEVLYHMINHSTYHRGQIALLLKLHGFDFPDTDFIIWLNRASGELNIARAV